LVSASTFRQVAPDFEVTRFPKRFPRGCQARASQKSEIEGRAAGIPNSSFLTLNS
jgi:hypothetical protein